MSYFKPDYDYDPLNIMSVPEEGQVAPKLLQAKQELLQCLKNFLSEIPDANLVHFSKSTNLTFRTNTNVFDSITFFRKFCDAFFFSYKKTFPHISENELNELREKFEEIQKYIDKISKHSNVENKYLLALIVGMLMGVLDYEHY
jgi:hypothetical protein